MTENTNAQVHHLTGDQIRATYSHFEYGDPAPQGVKLSESFTLTMGRYWSDGAAAADGHFVYY